MTNPNKIAVLGGGSFGTAIANMAATNGNTVYQWMRNEERAKQCQALRENPFYLPGFPLHEMLTITHDLQTAITDAALVFVSIPSQSFRSVVKLIQPYLSKDTGVISTAKGIEPENFTLMSQVLEQELPDHPIGVLSGPNFAKEIVVNQQTGTVIASEYDALITLTQKALSSGTFRVYANHDRYGVELGGALKNIYAIVCGMAAALGTGHNTQAMLLTRSLAEMSRLAQVLGANPMTFLGLAGMGDLILTCTSDLSRNYRVGYAVGSGKSLNEAITDIGQVAEGVNTVKLVKEKAESLNVYMPLATGLYAILFESRPVIEVAQQLMQGEQNYDVEFSGKLSNEPSTSL
ncbi:NAD(P)H-dependent glycerol-3-phosphate dehydrogenase [Marinibactrum halimedae]|uniref:Glycerol-3-phosphate dehydrogenase [NAD(P)+] n=1 Tax=Marinibactrum halimedae TaxID=1444977 RepID=A0AA37TBA0_9GAMM|nr:NAD(P)H-dependent glycerol-3-phosphate dehydrogenase [Marinibactrum halimedae]MCD9458701.1 NAD(P)H-dependent glycerol-3-phosphate dehydrogenase [Marinibactrum halimedae]GLS25932.1 glycerol-3-phosphate dehydrogenase [NAD(P)+] [Marinibactrum halimedae]